MSDREKQQKFFQNSTIKNSEYDRQNTNIIGRSDTDNYGNILATDSENKQGTEIKILIWNVVSAVVGIIFFIYIVPFSRLFVGEKFYASVLFLFISLLISILVAFLINLLIKKIINIK